MATNNSSTVPAIPLVVDNSNLRRLDFPKGFVFGTGTSAFQVEGAAAIGGKGKSSWDDWCKRNPENIKGGTNGNVAADMYHRFEEDIKSMKKMGFDAYRFSIAWSRVLPGGRCSAGINREGIDYYNRLIDTIKAHGMEPYVTLFHWDTPHILEEEYGGFLSDKIVPDFLDYAELCFWEFGDRVKWWTTLNEPWSYSVFGYVMGATPPGISTVAPSVAARKLPPCRSLGKPDSAVTLTREGDLVKNHKCSPAKDCYTVAKNLLLAHAHAVDAYRTRFLPFQKGQIGIVLNSQWYVPLDPNSPEDVAAARRAQDFVLGWFLDPCVYGRWPESMTRFVPDGNLPEFTPKEALLLKGSIDYIGFNYYTTSYASHDPTPEGEGYVADQQVEFSTVKDGEPIGDPSGSSWLTIVPWGIYELLKYQKEMYPDYPVYITETGVSEVNEDDKLTAREACKDAVRTKFHQDHLANVLRAIQEGVDCRGYIAWTWCDNFEWMDGYTVRFGITYIDFKNNETRYPKDSAFWFAKFLKGDKPTGIIPMEVISSKRRLLQETNSNKDAAAAAGKRSRK